MLYLFIIQRKVVAFLESGLSISVQDFLDIFFKSGGHIPTLPLQASYLGNIIFARFTLSICLPGPCCSP